MAFFEQIGKRLTDAGQNVAQQTRDIADVSKLNSAISENEKKISQLFLLIGQSYYERHKDDEVAEEPEMIAEITALYADTAARRERIKQIKGVVKCGNCGAEVPAHAAFCNACGTKVIREEPAAASPEEMCICPACRAFVEKEYLFCTNCGTRMETSNE